MATKPPEPQAAAPVAGKFTVEFSLQAGDDSGPIVAATPSDIDAAIDRIAAADPLWHTPTAFIRERPRNGPAAVPDHGLKIAIDPGARAGALAYFGPAGEGYPTGIWMTLGRTGTRSDVKLYRDLANSTEFPPNATILLSAVREAVHEFHASGGQRPANVNWQPSESW